MSELLKALKSQYHATLSMHKSCIESCPEDLWQDPSFKNRFWHISFHTIFYTHLYLHDSENHFEAWENHLEQYEYLKYRSDNYPTDKAIYSKEDLLEYLELCQARVDSYLASVNFSEPSGFSWLPFNKLELHLYNIRHAQHHTGQLGDRLRESADIGVRWVGKA